MVKLSLTATVCMSAPARAIRNTWKQNNLPHQQVKHSTRWKCAGGGWGGALYFENPRHTIESKQSSLTTMHVWIKSQQLKSVTILFLFDMPI